MSVAFFELNKTLSQLGADNQDLVFLSIFFDRSPHNVYSIIGIIYNELRREKITKYLTLYSKLVIFKKDVKLFVNPFLGIHKFLVSYTRGTAQEGMVNTIRRCYIVDQTTK